MNYSKYAEKNQFGELTKVAADLAKALDHSSCQLTGKEEYQNDPRKVRPWLFDLFCAVCVRAGVAVPALEADLLEAIIGNKPSEKNDAVASALVQAVEERLLSSGNITNQTAYILAQMVQIMPGVVSDSFYGVKFEQIKAAINLDLIRNGLEPIRSNYSEMKIGFPTDRQSPPRPLRVLVVDDDIDPGFKTMTRLAGWPGIEVDFYHYKSQLKSWRASDEEKLPEIGRVCLDIVGFQPDIVLMDEGMGNISGHEVTKELLTAFRGVVVANTGGNDDELRAAGALPNCNKGENLRSLESAFSRF